MVIDVSTKVDPACDNSLSAGSRNRQLFSFYNPVLQLGLGIREKVAGL